MVSASRRELTPGLPGLPREPGLETLSAIESRFATMRRQPPDLAAAVREALGAVDGDGQCHRRRVANVAANGIAAAMDAAAGRSELAYHNRHHTVEVVLAMGWLCARARAQSLLSAEECRLGVVAMVGHDLGHDGSPPDGGRLERLAADFVCAIATASAVPPADRAAIRAVILGTDPAEVAANMARVFGELPPGPLGARVDLLRALANEADIMASLLPSFGWHLAEKLAEEWRASGHPARAAQVLGFSGRLSFLRVYNRFTAPASSLGLDALHARQLSAFMSAARLPGGADFDTAAAELDSLAPSLAHARYRAALDAR